MRRRVSLAERPVAPMPRRSAGLPHPDRRMAVQHRARRARRRAPRAWRLGPAPAAAALRGRCPRSRQRLRRVRVAACGERAGGRAWARAGARCVRECSAPRAVAAFVRALHSKVRATTLVTAASAHRGARRGWRSFVFTSPDCRCSRARGAWSWEAMRWLAHRRAAADAAIISALARAHTPAPRRAAPRRPPPPSVAQCRAVTAGRSVQALRCTAPRAARAPTPHARPPSLKPTGAQSRRHPRRRGGR